MHAIFHIIHVPGVIYKSGAGTIVCFGAVIKVSTVPAAGHPVTNYWVIRIPWHPKLTTEPLKYDQWARFLPFLFL